MSARLAVVLSVLLCAFVFFAGLLVFAVLKSGAVITIGSFGGGASGTLENGRSVTAHSDAWSLSSSYSGDTAEINTAGRTIVVRPQVILVDGRAVSSIDPATKAVEVRVQGDSITFIADGRTVATCPR